MFLNGFLLIKVTVLIAVSKEIYSFNFEEKYHLIATGKPGSYFGYSLAVQENGAKKWYYRHNTFYKNGSDQMKCDNE